MVIGYIILFSCLLVVSLMILFAYSRIDEKLDKLSDEFKKIPVKYIQLVEPDKDKPDSVS